MPYSAWYGVAWRWVGKTVQVAATAATVEIWSEAERLAVHPRADPPRPSVWCCRVNGSVCRVVTGIAIEPA